MSSVDSYNAEYQRRVNKRQGGNLAQVRAHLVMLAESGVTLQTVAEATGLSYPSLFRLRSSATRVTSRVADLVLSVGPEIAPDNARVPAERLAVIVAELERRGWSRWQIGQRLGLANSLVVAGKKKVTLGRVREVAALLDEPAPIGDDVLAAQEAQRERWRDQQRQSRKDRGMNVRTDGLRWKRERWRDSAACRDRGLTDVFLSSQAHDQRRARRICSGCLVRSECLEWVLDQPTTEDFYGICGGTDYDERVKMRRQR